jgi:hypothetical protein
MTREERMLHGAYNVGDLDKAIKYVSLYCKVCSCVNVAM